MPTMESVKLNHRPRLKLIPTFSMVHMDIMDIMESVMLRPSLKLTLLFCTEDTTDTILDMLDTMDMLDIPTPTGVKSSLATR